MDDSAYQSARDKIESWRGLPAAPLDVSLTHAELESLRDEALADLDRACEDEHLEEDMPEEEPRRHAPKDLTCFNCAIAHTCPYVYDTYNVDGDCMAEK